MGLSWEVKGFLILLAGVWTGLAIVELTGNELAGAWLGISLSATLAVLAPSNRAKQ